MSLAWLVLLCEIIGVTARAMAGVMAANEKPIDLFGVLMLGIISALGGGVMRDLLLGLTPPAAFNNSVYLAFALGASALILALEAIFGENFHLKHSTYMKIINALDVVALAVFTVSGVESAIVLGHEMEPGWVIFIGTVSGVGGGLLRDVLLGKVPLALSRDLYLAAAVIGAVFCYSAYRLGASLMAAMIAGMALIFTLRVLSGLFAKRLPRWLLRTITRGAAE